MSKKLLIPLAFLLLAACTPSEQAMNGDEHSSHGNDSSMAASVDRLSNSPRHQEWVEVKNGDKTIYTWVVYPEVSTSAPVVVLIHENKGLNDWARGLADQVAEEGYIAVAPDLLSGFSDEMTRTSDFPTPDEATKAIGQLKPDDVMSDLKAVTEWAKSIEASDGTIVSAGFCWGGGQSFRLATETEDLSAALVFYGTAPTDASAYDNISAPVFGFYGGADARITGTVEQTAKFMKDANKDYDYKIYEGAGHAFMRLGEDPSGSGANVAARNAAWTRMKEILATLR